jgi:hypothetical protein
MYSVTTLRNRQQRLREEGDYAPSTPGSPGRSPRTLRPERLHWLSKPGKARCRADWTQGSVRSLQLLPSHLPADRRTVPWAQIAAWDAQSIAMTNTQHFQSTGRDAPGSRIPSTFPFQDDDMT